MILKSHNERQSYGPDKLVPPASQPARQPASQPARIRQSNNQFFPSENLVNDYEDSRKKAEELGRVVIKPVPGTMKLHAIEGGLELMNVYCRTGDMCEHWKKVTIIQEPDEQTTAPTDLEKDCNKPNGEKSLSDNGRFNELDTSEPSVQTTAPNDLEKDCNEPKGEKSTSENVRFNELEASEETSTKDDSSNIDEYSPGDFVAAIGKPKPTGRTKRAFKYEEQELQLIQTFFDARNGI
ncbi:hypothetical protein DPMN_008057 [Dreissena polymorpha]|uniref:Uncharacterized protein n=1 Tax=Dreissena polymorpha TaxID=45954 RepID=A0A9D4RYT3_DREPO|nr:hypothetical protein DPMN_008057 [Dreissena polymorpha]